MIEPNTSALTRMLEQSAKFERIAQGPDAFRRITEVRQRWDRMIRPPEILIAANRVIDLQADLDRRLRSPGVLDAVKRMTESQQRMETGIARVMQSQGMLEMLSGIARSAVAVNRILASPELLGAVASMGETQRRLSDSLARALGSPGMVNAARALTDSQRGIAETLQRPEIIAAFEALQRSAREQPEAVEAWEAAAGEAVTSVDPGTSTPPQSEQIRAVSHQTLTFLLMLLFSDVLEALADSAVNASPPGTELTLVSLLFWLWWATRP